MLRPAFSRRHVLLGPAAVLLAAAAERGPVAASPVSRLETPWWRARHEAKLVEARGRRVDLVWLGDSITQFWELDGPEPWREYSPGWQRYYGDRNALNLGFSGDSTAHLLWRMQNGELADIKPKAAVILIGANNMGRVHWSAPQTVAGIEAVVEECKRRLPGTKILLLGILPSIRSKYVTRTTELVNRELEVRYGGGRVAGLTYMDVGRIFMKEGQVDPEKFLDIHLNPQQPPLHPSPQAMMKIAEAIEPTLAGLLGDRAKPRA